MRVLVVDGTRFIGPHGVKQLVAQGHETLRHAVTWARQNLPAQPLDAATAGLGL